MAWERRNNRLYLYESRRVGDRVEKVYIGRGLAAAVADRMATDARLDRLDRDERLAASEAALEPLDRVMDELDEVAGEWLEATLLAAGYWRPNYSWRSRRDVRSGDVRNRVGR